MSTPQKKKPKKKVATASSVRKAKFYLLEGVIPGEYFKMNRIDVIDLFFEGTLPTPILAAVDDLQGMRRTWAGGNIVGALDSMTPEQRANIKELMRRIAARACAEPRVTLSKKEALANPDTFLWAGGHTDVEGDLMWNVDQEGDIDLSGLMVVWRSVMGESDVVTLPYDEAETFRAGESESPDPNVLDGEDVRTEAVVVDSDAGTPGEAAPVAVSLHSE